MRVRFTTCRIQTIQKKILSGRVIQRIMFSKPGIRFGKNCNTIGMILRDLIFCQDLSWISLLCLHFTALRTLISPIKREALSPRRWKPVPADCRWLHGVHRGLPAAHEGREAGQRVGIRQRGGVGPGGVQRLDDDALGRVPVERGQVASGVPTSPRPATSGPGPRAWCECGVRTRPWNSPANVGRPRRQPGQPA